MYRNIYIYIYVCINIYPPKKRNRALKGKFVDTISICSILFLCNTTK